jgi:hypothetical protein
VNALKVKEFLDALPFDRKQPALRIRPQTSNYFVRHTDVYAVAKKTSSHHPSSMSLGQHVQIANLDACCELGLSPADVAVLNNL